MGVKTFDARKIAGYEAEIRRQSARIAALEAALIGILGQIDAGHRFDGCAHMRESCPRCLAEKKAEEVLNG